MNPDLVERLITALESHARAMHHLADAVRTVAHKLPDANERRSDVVSREAGVQAVAIAVSSIARALEEKP